MKISKLQREKITELAKEFDLKIVLLFGSLASQETHSESDVDLAVLTEKDLSFDKEIRLNTLLSGVFKDKKPIDLIVLNKAHPLLLKQILSNCQILYTKSPVDFFNFEAQALQKYKEAEPLFKIRREKLKTLLKNG